MRCGRGRVGDVRVVEGGEGVGDVMGGRGRVGNVEMWRDDWKEGECC